MMRACLYTSEITLILIAVSILTTLDFVVCMSNHLEWPWSFLVENLVDAAALLIVLIALFFLYAFYRYVRRKVFS